MPEPAACAGRLNPGQSLIPQPLADMLDWHVWPAASSWPNGARARTVCEHVDYELIWSTSPELFSRHVKLGVPPPEVMWAAKHELAELGYRLMFDMQVEQVDDEIALVIYGAGIVGRMSDAAWQAAAPLLTTCCAAVREPRDDVDLGSLLEFRPARDPIAGGARPISNRVKPELWQVGDWIHTWWSYPASGPLRDGCTCVAHTASERVATFGGSRKP